MCITLSYAMREKTIASSALCCESAFAVWLVHVPVGWKHSTVTYFSHIKLLQSGVGVKINHQNL